MGRRGKKGQITLYIIIGIIILVATGMYFFMRQQGDDVGGSFRDAIIREVPQEMLPISSYIDKCLLDVSRDGVILIGLQGGYAYPRESGIRSSPVGPTEGNALDVPMIGHDVPYWWYLESPNDCNPANCIFTTEMPYLRKASGNPSIESELETYIDRNIGQCLNDLQVFRSKGWTIEIKEAPSAQVQVTGDDVLVLLNYRFRAQHLETAEHNVESFIIRLPVPLQKVYTQAFLLTYLQQTTNFLEHHTMNIIAAFDYDGEDSGRLPSLGHTDFAFGSTNTWSERTVEVQMKELLEAYVPWLQVESSINHQARLHENQGVQAMIYNGTLLPGDRSVEGLDVSFMYLKDIWGRIYFSVCDGGFCQPRMAGITFPAPVGVSLYSFDYDLSYPILVEVTDPDALGEKGYSFYTALEVNVRNNRPLTYNMTTVRIEIDDDRSHISDLLCVTRTSGNITVAVKDTLGRPVPKAAISYSAGDTTCPIGMTDADGLYIGRFPAAFGGIMSVSREGHVQTTVHQSIDPGDEFLVEIVLYDETPVDIEIEGWLLAYDGIEWAPVTSALYLLHPEDSIIVLFERKAGPGEEEFFRAAELPGNGTATVSLVPGDYHLEAFGIYLAEFDFYDSTHDIRINFTDSLSTAALSIDFTILPAHLAQGKDLVVRVAAVNPYNLATIDHLEQLSVMQEVTEVYPSLFQPYWR